MLAWPTGGDPHVIGDPITVAPVVAKFALHQSYSQIPFPNSAMCIRNYLPVLSDYSDVSSQHVH